MALGHALLHPERVRRALDADARADARGAAVDLGLGIFGFGDPGPAAAAWAEGVGARAQPIIDALARVGREGPFAAFFEVPKADIPGLMAQLGGLLDAAATLDADALRRRINAALDLVLDALPELRLPAIATTLQGEIDAALGILEAPLTGGRRDPAAHRAFRTAAEIRRRLRRLGDPLPPRLANFDLKATLRAQLTLQLSRLEAPALAALAAQIGALKTEFGALFDALGRVSVTVEVRAGGPQGMPDAAPTVADEAKVAPYARGHALWWLDLVTGIVAVFNLIWEMVRTSNFRGRGFDGTVSVLLLLWQIARVATRAAMPAGMAEWPAGSHWLFSDQGDFVLSLGARLLASFDGAQGWTNWVGSVLIRGLKHVTAVSQPRFIYQFARSVQYLQLWKALPEPRPPPSFIRATWAAWGPMWMCGAFFALFPSWEDFHLEGFPTSLLVPLIIGGVCAIAACIGMLVGEFSTKLPKGVGLADDHASRGVMTGVLVAIVILVAILLEGLESDDKGVAIGLLILVAGLLAVVLFLAWLPQTATWGSYVLIALAGVIAAFAVPFVLWWDYIDDGRDKPGLFDALDADSSPYRLPYTAGENWMCSQGTHGIFSHHTADGTTNHYAYDFNEAEGATVRAAREGVVTQLVEAFENRKQEPNFLHVLHTSWAQGHDPGADDERVLTFANYFHLMQNGALPVLGQPVRRGEDIARLDSTGRSAQQHIHIATEEQQRGEAQGLPFVFGDDDTKRFRHYPLLAWIPGKGANPGKPISYAFYTSANAAPADGPAPMALEFALDVGGPGGHLHRVIVPAELVGGAADPVEVFVEPQRGHTHRITLTRAAIARLRGPDPLAPGEVTVGAAPDGHVHAPLTAPLRELRLQLAEADDATAGKHRHGVWPNPATLGGGIPATNPFTSGDDYNDDGDTPTPHHTHQVEFNAAAIAALLRRERPAAGDVTVQVANGHSHTLDDLVPQPTDGALPGLNAALVAPPTARLAVGTPGPYRLWGGQAVLRINDRVNEAWLYGAHRPRVLPDLPAERGLAAAEALRFDTTDISPGTDTRGSARLAAAAMTRALRASGGALQHAALAAAPVIVVETLRRGSAARLRRTAGGSSVFGAGAGPDSRGAGDLPDLAAIPRATLAAHIEGILRNGWAPPPAPVVAAFRPGGPPLDLGPSAPRNAAVLGVAAAPADGAIATPQPLPLAPGPVGVTGGWAVPILAAPAVLLLDLTHPAMAGAQRQATPLILTVSGTDQPVAFDAADADAVAVARRIMLQADGVRASATDASTVLLATLAGGADIGLALRKDPGLALVGAVGSSATLAVGTPVRDSGAVPPAVLHDVAVDAAARAALPYDPALVQPTATVQGDRIRLTVAAGNTIRPVAQPLPLLPGSGAAAVQWESDPLPATLSLAGSAWIDIELAGAVVRVPLTGEPARLELGPLPQLPAAGDRLRLELDGVAAEVAFDGTEASVGGVAARIAGVLPEVTVRLAWQVTAAGTLHGEGSGPGTLRLAESPALNLLGFLRNRTTLVDTAAGPVGDALAAGPQAPIDGGAPAAALRRRGARSTRLVVPPPDPPSLAAAPGDTLNVTAPAPDPLGFVVGPGHVAVVGAALPFALPGQVASWSFTAAQGGTDRAVWIGQLAALPATLRGLVAPDALAGAALSLRVTVTAPGGARPEVTVDLAGFANAEDAAARLAAVPGVTAFAVTLPGTPPTPIVQVETLGRGTGWSLRLAGRDALVALGFRPPLYDPAADALEVAGGGTVADGAAVTSVEVRAMLQRVADGAVAPEPDPPPPYAVSAGTAVLLAPGVTGGPVPALDSDPSAYAPSLGATVVAGALSVPLGTTRPLGALLRVRGGPRRTTVPLFGSPAALRSPDPVPAEGSAEAVAQLAFVQAGGLAVRVDGSLRSVPAAPNSFASLDEGVEWIAAAIVPGWAGLAADPPGVDRHLVLRSGRYGTGSAIELVFPAAGAPASGLFGFAAGDAATGSGTVGDADAMPIAGGGGTLQRSLETSAGRTDAPQTLFRAVADDAAGTLRLVPNSGATVIGVPGGLPAGMTAAAEPGAGTILLTTGPARALDSRLIDVNVTAPGSDPAVITAAFWGAPARLPPLVPPTSLAVLAGTTLDLIVDGAAVAITLTAPASLAALAAQLARGSGWRLRAFARGGALVIETLRQGSAAALTLAGGSAVTDNPASGFSALPRPLAATGAGSLPDLAAATPSAIGAALEAGWLVAGTPLDDVRLDVQRIDRRAYAPTAVAGDAWVLSSRRAGIAGRLEWLAATLPLPGEPVWDASLGRGAAVRAAVALPAIAGPVSPNGPLVLRLDDNTGPDLPTVRDVTVTFDGTALDAAGVAARIDAALRAANAGAAAAWPDGTVVIETAYPGLGGSLAVPAPGARGPADLLVGAGAVLSARGWPGGGRAAAFQAMPQGWRAVRAAAAAGATYEFRAGGRTTGPVAVEAGVDATAAALALNLAFGATAGGGGLRLGLAAVVDGALCVEATVTPMSLLVNGTLSVATTPGRPGDTPEPPSDDAFDLRRTELVRTLRLVRAATDAPAFASAQDLGWLRHPTRRVEGVAPAGGGPTPDPVLTTAGFPRFPDGRWLVAARPDAARVGDTADAAALRAATAMAPLVRPTSGPGSPAAPLMLRYWVTVNGANGQLGGSAAGPEPFMLDLLTWR